MNEYELEYWNNNDLVVGIDEVGRGPICGPLVVVGVVLPSGYKNDDIKDSKKLSSNKREQLFKTIIDVAIKYQIEIVSPKEVDELNIYRATQKAMEKIASESKVKGILTDAMPLLNGLSYQAIIKGDQKSISIAAASIVAKVIRDGIMMAYDHLYPEYGFSRHKGYPTKAHIEAINQYGLKDFYRMTYGPCIKVNQVKLDI